MILFIVVKKFILVCSQGYTMGDKGLVRFIVAAIMISQSFLLIAPSANANLVNTNSTSHQVTSQSTYVEFSGASSSTGYQPADLDEAYDGDSSTGSFGRIRTYPCENYNSGPACTTGSHGEVEFRIQTNSASSSSFTIDFTHQFVVQCTTNPKVTLSIWNIQSSSWVQMDSQTSTGGYDVNTTYSSDYMSSGGEILVKWRAESGCSSNSGNDYVISRLYEFHVYAPDADGDGVADSSDDCQNGASGWTSSPSTDYDSDGCNDLAEDSDDDNDGVDDGVDYCPKGHLDWTSGALTDHDSDGCNDIEEDSDDDNDTITDNDDYCSKGQLFISDSLTDYDSDGCEDASEDNDDDNDSVIDNDDDCPKGILGWLSDSSTDNDGDGCRDSDEDSDDDGDGYSDTVEDDCQSDPLDSQSIPANSDGTGDCDFLDDDDDDDGTPDVDDDFPFDPSEDTDTDEDGIGDNADLDDDWDGYNDTYEESCDSDPLDNTSTPLNFDNDDLCDELDDDDDNDGYNDSIDVFQFNALEWADFDGDGTGDNYDDDDDNDGASDTYEAGCGTLPNDNSSVPGDLDGDGQCDGMDLDDDGDGWSDTLENNCGFNSMSNASTPPDMDGDGQCDVLDDDIDGDGWSNDEESDCGTNELDNTSSCQDSFPTNPDDQSNTSGSNSGGDVNNGTSDEITNPDDEDEISDSDSKKEDSNDDSIIGLPLIIAIIFIVATLSIIVVFFRKEAEGQIQQAKKEKEKLEGQLEKQGEQMFELGKQAIESVKQTSGQAIESMTKTSGQAMESVTQTSGQAMESVIQSAEVSSDSYDEMEIKKQFIKECLRFLNAPKHEFSTEIYNAIIPFSGDENRQEKLSDSFNLGVKIRIGLEYYDDLIPDEQEVVDLLNQIIKKFFSFTGGALDRKMGGWRNTTEPTLELSASMQYLDLYANLVHLRQICQVACWNFNQTTVYVELSGPEMKFDEVNPLNDKQKQWIEQQKGGKKPVKFSQGIFEMLDERKNEIDSGFSHA